MQAVDLVVSDDVGKRVSGGMRTDQDVGLRGGSRSGYRRGDTRKFGAGVRQRFESAAAEAMDEVVYIARRSG